MTIHLPFFNLAFQEKKMIKKLFLATSLCWHYLIAFDISNHCILTLIL